MYPLKFKLSFLAPHYWLLWFGFAILRLSVYLPYGVLMRIGKLLGLILMPFARRRRKIIARNLELCFPHKSMQERQLILRKNFANMGMTLFETAITWWASEAKKQKLAKFEGLEHLLNAQNKHGILLVAAHFTTLEIGCSMLETKFSAHHFYRKHPNAVFDYMQHKMRQKNAKYQLIERSDIKSILKTLRAKKAVWYAPDQDYGREHSLFVPFFGISAATITATSRIAKITKAKIIPFMQVRLPNYQGYKIKVFAPLDNFPTNNLEQDCITINSWLEQIISTHPEQYLWAHRRFKTRPIGEPSLYKL